MNCKTKILELLQIRRDDYSGSADSSARDGDLKMASKFAGMKDGLDEAIAIVESVNECCDSGDGCCGDGKSAE